MEKLGEIFKQSLSKVGILGSAVWDFNTREKERLARINLEIKRLKRMNQTLAISTRIAAFRQEAHVISRGQN